MSEQTELRRLDDLARYDEGRVLFFQEQLANYRRVLAAILRQLPDQRAFVANTEWHAAVDANTLLTVVDGPRNGAWVYLRERPRQQKSVPREHEDERT